MALTDMSNDDLQVIGAVLHAAATGPFFDDDEFSTLFGFERSDIGEISQQWPGVDLSSAYIVDAVRASLNNVLGYPHGMSIDEIVGYPTERLGAILERLKGDRSD